MDHTIIKEAATKIVANIKAMEDDITVLQNKQDIISTSDTTMTGSYPGRLSIEEIGGKCEQASTTGKNLCPTFERNVNSDSHFSDKIYVKGNTTYVLSFVKERIPGVTMTNQGLHQCSYDEYNSSGSKISTITTNPIVLPSGSAYCEHVIKTNVNTSFIVVNFTNNNNDTNINTKVYNVQVEEGSVATPYEPYTGGQPSPSPDYPQEIKKTVVSEIKTMGSNWLDISKIDGGGSDSYTIEDDGKKITVTSKLSWSGIRFDILHLKGKSFYLVGDNITASGAYAIDVNYRVNGVGLYEPVNGGIITIPKDADMANVRIIANNTDNTLDVATSVSVENLRIVEVLDTLWEPYTESAVTLSQPIELYGIGDVQDTIEDGKVVRKCGVKVFNGSESIITQTPASTDTIYFLCAETSAKVNEISGRYLTGALCNKLIERTPEYLWNNSDDGFCINSDAWNIIRFRLGSDVSSTDLAKAKLKEWYDAGDPMSLVYELATPVIEELPLVDQMALNSLKTYDGITYVETDSEIEPTFQVEYGATKIGGYTLEGILAGANGVSLGQSNTDRITALEATLVNNI